ncbi:MAG: hypothetical protein Aurels2KO_51200 [Aureliella sp.]
MNPTQGAAVKTDLIADVLFAQAIQIAIVGLGAWLLFVCFARNRPHLSHALWGLVLIKCLTPPIVTSPFGLFDSVDIQRFSSADRVSAVPNLAALNDSSKTNQSSISIEFERLSAESQQFQKVGVAAPYVENSQVLRFRDLFLAIWVLGVLLAILNIGRKLLMLSRQLNAYKVNAPDWLQEVVRIDSNKIGLRRPPRLLVVDCQVGPAVIGLFFPRLILPASLLKPELHPSTDKANLELLIAHELVHIRRGDLFWSLFQTIAACVWWFHPAVRIACAMLSRESERCCDEATIAHEGCGARTYARALLHVLELRHDLSVPRPFPGIRKADITISRMERIMTLGTGSRIQGPWWIPLVMFVGLGLVLPRSERAQAQERPSGGESSSAKPDSGDQLPSKKVGAVVDKRKVREQWENIDLRKLASEPPAAYRVGAGDILGISVSKILPELVQGQAGFPITVIDDGTISLPLIDPIKVAGLAVAEIGSLIEKAYLDRGIVKERPKALVSLVALRRKNVLVWRRDLDPLCKPELVSLKGHECDVLHAMAASGWQPRKRLQKMFSQVRIVRAGEVKGIELDRVMSRIESNQVKSELLISRVNDQLYLHTDVSVALGGGDLLIFEAN